MYTYSLQLNGNLGTDEGTSWITAISGEILYLHDEAETLAGKFKCFVVDCDSAESHGMSPQYLLDQLSETYPFASLYNQHGFFLPQILDDPSSGNLLILDRVEILPQHRGRGILPDLNDEITRLFGARSRLLAFKSFPLQLEIGFLKDLENDRLSQWDKELGLSQLEQDPELASQKLSKYYKSLGFNLYTADNNEIMYKVL